MVTTTSSKRIRFGMVYEGARPAMDSSGFLKELGVVDAEGAEKDGQQFILFTVLKPRRTCEVQQAVDAYNSGSSEGIRLVQFGGEQQEVVTFERGHKFQLHPIYQTIRVADAAKDGSFWAWSSSGVAGDVNNKKRRRVINELESDLVEASIAPSAPKRASGKENHGSEPQIGKKQTSSKTTKKRSSIAAPSNQSSYRILENAADIMHLVKEVTRSKDETIRAKDQMIKLLEARKVCVCGSGLGAE